MRINHNISAINTYRNQSQTNDKVSKSIGKLSSGLRITQAADDSAGLAISEKMRGQIRGLQQARQNIQNGISLVQVAEAGLGKIADPNLLRLRELSVQAANDTLTLDDRKIIQEEMNQIIKGIDDIANTTEFNTIPLLNGAMQPISTNGTGGSSNYNYENVLEKNAVKPNGVFAFKTKEGYPTTSMDNDKTLVYEHSNTSRPSVRIDNQSYNLVDSSDITETTEVDGAMKTVFKIKDKDVEVTQLVRVVKDKYEIEYKIKNTGSASVELGFQFHLDVKLGDDDNAPFIVNGSAITEQRVYEGNSIPNEFTVYNQHTGINSNAEFQAGGIIRGDGITAQPDKLAIGQYSAVSSWDFNQTGGSVDDSGYSLWWYPREISAGDEFSVNTFYGQSIPPTIDNPIEYAGLEPKDLILQVGPNEGQSMKIQLSDVRTRKLGISNLNVLSHQQANHALSLIDKAIEKVTSERTKFGASQNALEHLESNVGNYKENMTAAESRIRDADIAQEVTILTGQQILLQSSQAMMVQANQITQGILQLLK